MLIQLKIMRTTIFIGAIVFALFLIGVTFMLESWHFVIEVNVHHIISIYEIGFPFVAIFLFSQLFAEELEEGILKWLFSLPLRGWVLLAGRWGLGIICLLFVYYGSLLVVDLAVISIPWNIFTTSVLIPSLWLGHLALSMTLVSKNYIVGIAAPLFYWIFEIFSKGMLTQHMFLFMGSFPRENVDLDWNRTMLFMLSDILLLACCIVLRNRSYYMK
jgi:ABC-type transport system involved in multi-copper enzyme maturation permease subunit